MNNFAELDMTNVEVKDSGPVLKGGVYLATISDAEWVSAKNNQANKMAVVTFEDDHGNGQITNRYNLINSSAEAQRIGREQFKGMLVKAGHPNPDKPGDITSLKGLKCKILVKPDGFYMRDDGTKAQSYALKRVYDANASVPTRVDPDPAQAGGQLNGMGGMPPPSTSGLDDEIPF